MRREPLFLIFLVFIILGCPIYNNPSSGDNRTYYGLGVMSFISDLYDFPAATTTNLMLQIFNYGDYDADNVEAKLIGIQGAEPYVEQQGTPLDSLGILPKDNSALFYWTYKFKDPGVETDFTYSINAKVYYEYTSLATKEILFMNQAGTSSIETGSGSSVGPLNITLSSQRTVFVPNPTDNEFTVSVRIDNLDGGYPTCRQSSSSDTDCMETGTIEEESYKNYIKRIDLYFSTNWDLQHPEEWFTGDRSSGASTTGAACAVESDLYHCTYAPDFTTAENVDRRLYLTQGIRNVFNIGFKRGNGDMGQGGEKLESIKVEIIYSYVVSSPTIDLTVQGTQQTY